MSSRRRLAAPELPRTLERRAAGSSPPWRRRTDVGAFATGRLRATGRCGAGGWGVTCEACWTPVDCHCSCASAGEADSSATRAPARTTSRRFIARSSRGAWVFRLASHTVSRSASAVAARGRQAPLVAAKGWYRPIATRTFGKAAPNHPLGTTVSDDAGAGTRIKRPPGDKGVSSDDRISRQRVLAFACPAAKVFICSLSRLTGTSRMLTEIPRTEYDAVLDARAADVLWEAGIDSPPVDAFLLADRLGIEVARDRPVRSAADASRARLARLGGPGGVAANDLAHRRASPRATPLGRRPRGRRSGRRAGVRVARRRPARSAGERARRRGQRTRGAYPLADSMVSRCLARRGRRPLGGQARLHHGESRVDCSAGRSSASGSPWWSPSRIRRPSPGAAGTCPVRRRRVSD